jgi:hypothetical protein
VEVLITRRRRPWASYWTVSSAPGLSPSRGIRQEARARASNPTAATANPAQALMGWRSNSRVHAGAARSPMPGPSPGTAPPR